MEITDIRIRKVTSEGKLKGYVTVTFDDCFVVHNVKVIEGKTGVFIAMPSRKIAIFVHGCFWHTHQGCKYAKTPSTRTEFWTAKLQGNVDRDRRAVDKLAEMGWRVLSVWECSTRDPAAAEGLADALRAWIDSGEATGEISAQNLAAARRS